MPTPMSMAWQKSVSCGNAHILLRAGAQSHVRAAAAEIGFKYLRFHGTLADDMRVVSHDHDGAIRYNWQLVDELYDFLLDAGVRPCVELGPMPAALASGERTIFTWKFNVTLPRSMDEWAAFIEALVGHWAERYGLDEVREWYFEVWNEPNLKAFFEGTRDDYFRFYEATARAVKRVDTQLRTGGPSTARGCWIQEFLGFCSKSGAPLDFISTHVYADDDQFFTVDEGFQSKYLGSNYVADVVRHVRETVQASPFPDIPVLWTEWNSSWHPRSPWHDSANQAPFILRTVRQVSPWVDAFSYWVLSDAYEEGFYTPSAFVSLYGLMSVNGLRKPSYFAYHCLAILGDKAGPLEIEGLDDNFNGWIAERGDGIDVLLYHFRDWTEKRSPAARTVDLALPGMAGADIYRVDEIRNNIVSEWKAMGSPPNPTPAQLRELHDRNRLTVTETVPVSDGSLRVSLAAGSLALVRAK